MKVGILIFVIIGLIFAALYGNKLNKTENTPTIKDLTTLNNSTLPPQLLHMTVPYLRSRTYSSELGPRQTYQENGSYTSYLTSYLSDGLKINGLLTVPAGTPPKDGWPAIVFVHGYIPPSLYATTEKYVAYVDYLARNGFVVFKIDLRGHGDSEGTPGGGYFGSDYIVDTLSAYSALQNTDFVNKKAIGLWGHSMAGNVLMRSLAVKPEIPAAVIWAGAVYSYEDQVKYGLNDQSYRPPEDMIRRNTNRRQIFEAVGSPSAKSAFWQEVAPIYFLNDIKGAIEIHHAEDDDVVNIGYSRDLVTLLDKTKIPHEFYTYSTGGHNITDPSFSLAMQRTVDFYKKYLH